MVFIIFLLVSSLARISNAFIQPRHESRALGLCMAPKFDKKTQRWSPSSPEEGPEAGYGIYGTLIRQGPLPFFTRLTKPDDYEQAVLKFMAGEKGCSRDEAQGNMDAFFSNANDWMEIKMMQKKGMKYEFGKAPKTKNVILTSIWGAGVVGFIIRFLYLAATGQFQITESLI